MPTEFPSNQPIRITVKVKPGSRVSGVRPLAEGEYEVRVCEPAVEGRANAALIDLLSEYFNVPRRQVRILQGATARRKRVQIG